MPCATIDGTEDAVAEIGREPRQLERQADAFHLAGGGDAERDRHGSERFGDSVNGAQLPAEQRVEPLAHAVEGMAAEIDAVIALRSISMTLARLLPSKLS